jgi:hypothetical protein
VRAVRLLLELWLVPPFVRGEDDRGLGALVALVSQGDDAGVVQPAQDAPDAGGGQVVGAAGIPRRSTGSSRQDRR